jgi:hypothetical protein
MTDMIRKATPAQNKLPVRNQTTTAIIAAGKKRKMTFIINTSMSKPITSRINNAMISNNGGKPGNGINCASIF